VLPLSIIVQTYLRRVYDELMLWPELNGVWPWFVLHTIASDGYGMISWWATFLANPGPEGRFHIWISLCSLGWSGTLVGCFESMERMGTC
jgi:hypothetical protein